MENAESLLFVESDTHLPMTEYKKKFKITQVKFALSETQRKELLATAKANNYKHYLMILTQLHCGLRVGELVHLTIENVNFASQYIFVKSRMEDEWVDAWHPKTESSNRIIPITTEICELLREYIGTRTHGYVFHSNKIRNGIYTRFSKNSIIYFINKYAKACPSLGRTIGSHSLRRTYASYLCNAHIPVGKISQLLGHTSIMTTMKYLYSFSDLDFTEVRSVLERMV